VGVQSGDRFVVGIDSEHANKLINTLVECGIPKEQAIAIVDKNYKLLPQLNDYLPRLSKDLKEDLLVKLFADSELLSDEVQLTKTLSENSELANSLHTYTKDVDETISSLDTVSGYSVDEIKSFLTAYPNLAEDGIDGTEAKVIKFYSEKPGLADLVLLEVEKSDWLSVLTGLDELSDEQALAFYQTHGFVKDGIDAKERKFVEYWSENPELSDELLRLTDLDKTLFSLNNLKEHFTADYTPRDALGFVKNPTYLPIVADGIDKTDAELIKTHVKYPGFNSSCF
jgi:hypothetical protein